MVMRVRAIPDLLVEHLTSLAVLWKAWRVALTSPDYTLNDFRRLEERLEAHLDGLREGRDKAISLARKRLVGDPAESFAAASFLLINSENDSETTGEVINVFQRTEGAQLAALRDAMMRAPTHSLLPQLRELLAADKPAVAVGAAEILAIRNSLDPTARRLQEFFVNEDPSVRAGAWRVAALLDSAPPGNRVASRENPASE